MDNKKGYHLLITIVVEGYAEKVMSVAKKSGANGGTLIKGREVGTKGGFKFFNVEVEPEKDILLIVCKENDKNKIMTSILEKYGANTEAKGVCITLPIDNVVGMDLSDAKKVLKDFDIEYTGTGNVVVSQSPEAGNSIMIGSTIRLMLGN